MNQASNGGRHAEGRVSDEIAEPETECPVTSFPFQRGPQARKREASVSENENLKKT